MAGLTNRRPVTHSDPSGCMDETIIEEDNYYTDDTSDSDDESDVSSEDAMENFEL
jgi:hypothetical protein